MRDVGIESGDANSLTFPISFPSWCMSLTATRWYFNTSSSRAAIVHIQDWSKSGATLGGGINDSDGGYYYNTAGKYCWIAFGY